MDTLTTAPEDTYKQRRFDFISELEGTRTRAYDDSTGRPVNPAERPNGNVTVGVGFNMDAEGNRDQFKQTLGLTDKDFDEVYNGRRRLSADQVRRLFDATSVEAESIVADRFKDVDLTDHQRLALVSLAFNNPELVGPKLVDAVKAGKGDLAIKEILFNSNRKNMRALAARRYREASMFAGAVEAKATLPDYKTYLSNFA